MHFVIVCIFYSLSVSSNILLWKNLHLRLGLHQILFQIRLEPDQKSGATLFKAVFPVHCTIHNKASSALLPYEVKT